MEKPTDLYTCPIECLFMLPAWREFATLAVAGDIFAVSVEISENHAKRLQGAAKTRHLQAVTLSL